MADHELVGAVRPIRLSFPFEYLMLPTTQPNQRPGLAMNPTFYTQHETGNMNTGMGADAHARYLANGAPNDAGVSQQLSYHLTVDDTKAVQMLPVNEVAWHAGDEGGPGNMTAVACELCVNADADQARARANAQELAAAVLTALGLGIDRLVQHNRWSGKNCPALLRHDGAWPAFVDGVAERLAGADSATVFAKPAPVPAMDGEDHVLGGRTFWAVQRRYQVATPTTPRADADPAAEPTRAAVAAGDWVHGVWVVDGADGRPWAVTQWGSRIPMADLTTRVTVGPA